ncbi:unnamed protein product [Tuber melanosporum]|uniref:(Perigord truffle) hypothetical protein n=1 Tax=Tuber melanosporum (strain Mel28) TaxID=656061 RepID=D5GCA3_TUBMM|nr:uncharacterized protein GSTUM_00000648001 [Tuber melanosporum]CAZ82146.1 unnamed protein product [Tuber melanosporum]
MPRVSLAYNTLLFRRHVNHGYSGMVMLDNFSYPIVP